MTGWYPRSMLQKNPEEIRCFWIPSGFLAYFNNPFTSGDFKRFSLLEKDDSQYVLFGFSHAVYWCCNPYKAKESLALLWFFLATEIFEIRNHFSELQKLPLPGWNGSSDIWSLFHSGYFHRIPAVSPENFLICIISYCLLLWYIFLYKGNRYSLHIRKR